MKNPVIERAIKECGSQYELANKVGVSQGAVCFWLNGGGIKGKYIPLIAQASNGKVTESEILQSLSDC